VRTDPAEMSVARSTIAARVIRWLGAVLVIVAAIHLAVTPLIADFFATQMSAGAWQVVRPPALLNHVVVGILLVPVGATLVGLGPQLRTGSTSAWRLAIVHAAAIASLPVVLVSLVPRSLFAAPAFLVATALVTLTALILPVALVGARPARLRSDRVHRSHGRDQQLFGGRRSETVAQDTLDALSSYNWPGQHPRA
jgi:hypothetical protein